MPWILIAHLLGAAIWTVGHLILAVSVLPRALSRRDAGVVQQFEEVFERIGLPALVLQIVTGFILASRWIPGFWAWFDLTSPITRVVWLKLLCLVATLGLAVHARFRLIPALTNERLSTLALHILGVTVLGVIFVVLGASLRVGGI